MKKSLLPALVIIVAVLSFVFFSQTAKADNNRLVAERLKLTKISQNYEDNTLTEVLADLSQRTGVAIVFDPKAKDSVDPDEIMITMPLMNISAYNILQMIADENDLKLMFRYGIAWLTTPEFYYKGRNVLKIYDVRDITVKIQNFPGFSIRLRGNDTGDNQGPEWVPDEPVEPVTVESLEDIIPEFTGGGDWSVNAGASIQQLAGMLIIRQVPEVHLEIMRLLAQIRANR